jgi:hypothetical protein
MLIRKQYILKLNPFHKIAIYKRELCDADYEMTPFYGFYECTLEQLKENIVSLQSRGWKVTKGI